jgi:hypothetical protein
MTEKYVKVEVTTTLGATYVFPDMPFGQLKFFMESMAATIGASDTLVLTNLSGATMTVPKRIIATLKVDGKTVWTR